MKLRTLVVGSLTLWSACAALSEPLNAEDRLEAIRQALVVRAMEGPTQVRASAFIDGHGVLREASSFVTGMEVRGVRVMAYGRDMDGQPKATGLQMDSKHIPPHGCKANAQLSAWHQMLWDSQVLNIPAGSQWEAQMVEQQFRKQALLLSQQASAWRLNERKPLSDTYEQKLLGQGDMLYRPPGTSRMLRAQGVLVTDDEVRRLVDFASAQSAPVFENSIHKRLESDGGGDEENVSDEDEELVEKCLDVIRQEKKASTSLFQRRLRLGYTRAARILDILESRGYVGPGEGIKPREILVDTDTL